MASICKKMNFLAYSNPIIFNYFVTELTFYAISTKITGQFKKLIRVLKKVQY